MKKNNTWDELDFLFNRAKLKNIDIGEAFHDRAAILADIVSIITKNNLEYFLDEPTNTIFEPEKKNIFEDKIVIYCKNIDVLKKLFLKSKYEIVNSSNTKIYLKKNSRIFLLEINLEEFSPESLIKITYNEFEYIAKKINSHKKDNNFKVKNKIKLLFMNIFLKKITVNKFLNLEIEARNSKSWILRKKHLDLVTDSSKNTRVGEIVEYFENEQLFSNVQSQIIETPTGDIFEEPIYANKKFWMTGNNYFILPIVFKFKKNVVAYKDANNYIEKVKIPKLFSQEYYESLESMSDNEIKKFLRNNPIEISNNSIVSGKHRAFAMIGRLVDNEKYINFYAKYI